MKVTPMRLAGLVLSVVLLPGCATSRSEIALTSPDVNQPEPEDVGDTLAIISVTDTREFHEESSDPSLPSLGFAGADEASSKIRARAIGRKRNGYGKALGDVLLEEGMTVSDLVRQHLTAAANEAGYRVVSSENADITANVDIERFWSWMDPGFWTIKVTTVIATALTLSTDEQSKRIEVQTHDSYGVVTDSVWRSRTEETLAKFRRQASTQLRNRD